MQKKRGTVLGTLLCTGIYTAFVFMTPATAEERVSIGGHGVINAIDGALGSSSNGYGATDTASDYSGFRFLRLILFVRATLTDRLTLDVRPQIETRGVDGTTGATPRFGKAIGDQRALSTKVEFNGFTRAAATYVLPTSTELSVGYLNARFTWEYGNELFWENEINGSKFACNPWLGEMRDAGLEAVHYFDIGESSLPVYAYLLNGSGAEELNRTPVAMLAAEPQFGRLRFHVAAAGGTWDKDDEKLMARGSLGMSIAVKKFVFRSEGAIGYWQNRITGSPDHALPHGAYAKAMFPVASKIMMSIGANYAYHNFVGMFDPKPGEERYITVTPAFQVLTSSSSRIILQADLCDWRQSPGEGPAGDQELKFVQGTLGWRLTF